MTSLFVSSPLRSGHAPELPMDPVEYNLNQFQPFPTDNSELIDSFSDAHTPKVEVVESRTVELMNQCEKLRNDAKNAFRKGYEAGNKNSREWMFAGALLGALIVVLFAGAFPDAASWFMRVPMPDQMPPMTVASH